MTESPSTPRNSSNKVSSSIDIPIEIVTEEEMACLEAAMAASRTAICSPSRTSSLFRANSRSIRSITSLSKRGFHGKPSVSDFEDFGGFEAAQNQNKKNRMAESFLLRFRKKRGLSVTDFIGTEWCEKQMEYKLLFGKRETTEAMKAGKARHVKLEEEVVKKVEVSVKSVEDFWALRFLSFITGVNQLLFEGLTRELPLMGFVEGVWMVGIVDEIQMPEGEDNKNPIFVETKTRVRDTLPAEPQRRNGRLQLMCYKYLWDNLVAYKFPTKRFFEFFSLDPNSLLCEEIREHVSRAGIPAQTLDELMKYYKNTCSMLLPANNQMLLRYELQKDNSVLGEDQFTYDPDWLMSQIQNCLEFWHGEREASYTPEEERWKCRFCQFALICPSNTVSDPSSPTKTDNPSCSPC